jgi:hypothetical protein
MPTIEKLRIEPDRFEVNGATFSAAKRYIRETTASGYAFANGVTIAANYYFLNANTHYCYFKFNVTGIRYVDAIGATPSEPALVTPTPTVKNITT